MLTNKTTPIELYGSDPDLRPMLNMGKIKTMAYWSGSSFALYYQFRSEGRFNSPIGIECATALEESLGALNNPDSYLKTNGVWRTFNVIKSNGKESIMSLLVDDIALIKPYDATNEYVMIYYISGGVKEMWLKVQIEYDYLDYIFSDAYTDDGNPYVYGEDLDVDES